MLTLISLEQLQWNLERFAESLLPLINDDSKVAIEIATEVLKEFPEKYKEEWLRNDEKKIRSTRWMKIKHQES